MQLQTKLESISEKMSTINQSINQSINQLFYLQTQLYHNRLDTCNTEIHR